MSYETEVFATSKARNERWEELRKTHNDVIRYSDVTKLEEGGYVSTFFVGYPSLGNIDQIVQETLNGSTRPSP